MLVLEKVLRNMKTHVRYLNVTQMTDFRKDGHPSVYRKQNLSPEERKSPLLFQDCSHWCLPGVPDAWNEVLYAELLVNEKKKQQTQKRQQVKQGKATQILRVQKKGNMGFKLHVHAVQFSFSFNFGLQKQRNTGKIQEIVLFSP